MRAVSKYVLDRPIWRRFKPRFFARAVAHVRAGGHAAILHDDDTLEVLLGVGADGRRTELGEWAMLSIEHRRWTRVKDGPAEGLARFRVRKEYAGSVLDWCERDSVHPGTTRRMKLDCLDCGACCHDSNVLLDEVDLDRWREAGRRDLVSAANIVRRRGGPITLRFPKPGPCQHLGADIKCAIYALRPDNCRVFVVGSEACLAARESTLGLRDGAPVDDDTTMVVR